MFPKNIKNRLLRFYKKSCRWIKKYKKTFLIISEVVGIAAFILGVFNRCTEDKHWNILNVADVQLVSQQMLTSPLTFSAQYEDTGILIPEFHPVSSLPEANEQLERMEITKNYLILKQYKIKFTFTNNGKTTAKDLIIKMQIEDPVSKNWTLFQEQGPTDLAKSTSVELNAFYPLPILKDLTEDLNCKVDITYYDINKKKHFKTYPTTWRKIDNTWSYNLNSKD